MTNHRAIDVRCPTCGTPPGQRCTAPRPHRDRRQAAHAATAKADPTLCDRCGRPWGVHAARHQDQT